MICVNYSIMNTPQPKRKDKLTAALEHLQAAKKILEWEESITQEQADTIMREECRTSIYAEEFASYMEELLTPLGSAITAFIEMMDNLYPSTETLPAIQKNDLA